MKIEEFIELVKAPVSAGEEHLSSIEKIIADYPYFQTAHLLYAKALHNSGNLNYHTALKRTSVVAGDRTLLYRLIQQKPEVKIVVPVKEEKEIPKELPEEKEKRNEKQPEKPLSNISITYNVIPSLTVTKQAVTPEPEIPKQEPPELETPQSEITNTEPETTVPTLQLETAKPETLEQIVLKPVVEAYVETEILKITEKDEPDTSEKSFTDWLKEIATHTPAIQAQKEVEKAEEKQPRPQKTRTEKQQQLDRLLNEELRISKPDISKDFYAATEKTRSSVIENEDLVTETLAKIYVMQGNRSKAIRAYEILSLKYPEKSAYFASLITEIKNTIK